jgi:hypothetical protein
LIGAEPAILSAIADGVDLVVINRFGRAESLGRGLQACFAASYEAGIPLLTAVRPPYDNAWSVFHGGVAQDLPAELEPIVKWVRTTTSISASHSTALALADSRQPSNDALAARTSITARPLLLKCNRSWAKWCATAGTEAPSRSSDTAQTPRV